MLLKSLISPEIFNDERDKVLGVLNQLLVGVGTGQGHFSASQPAVEYTKKNAFYRFKGVAYNRITHYAEENGLCSLILNIPYSQLADPAQQSNVSAQKCAVCLVCFQSRRHSRPEAGREHDRVRGEASRC